MHKKPLHLLGSLLLIACLVTAVIFCCCTKTVAQALFTSFGKKHHSCCDANKANKTSKTSSTNCPSCSIHQLQADSDIRPAVVNAAQIVVTNYSWDHVSSTIVSVINSSHALIKGPPQWLSYQCPLYIKQHNLRL